MRIKLYLRNLYDQSEVALSHKKRMVKAQTVEALLYGFRIIWTLLQKYYSKLRIAHHRILLRVIGVQRKRPDRNMASYNRTLEVTGC